MVRPLWVQRYKNLYYRSRVSDYLWSEAGSFGSRTEKTANNPTYTYATSYR